MKDQKAKEIIETKDKFDNKKYENQELINKTEDIANSILKEKISNKYRDYKIVKYSKEYFFYSVSSSVWFHDDSVSFHIFFVQYCGFLH
jgi:hypothetical protein